MRDNLIPLAIVLILASCQQADEAPSPLTGLELTSAIRDAQRYLGDEAKLVAICGASNGVGYYLMDENKGFSQDRIESGVIGLALRSDGTPDVIHRDALKEMIVVSESGAQISRVESETDSDLGIWVATHPAGLVETYNLTEDEIGSLVLLWTGNRTRGIVPGRVITMVSSCNRLN